MPACSCPAICCGVIAALVIVSTVAGYFFVDRQLGRALDVARLAIIGGDDGNFQTKLNATLFESISFIETFQAYDLDVLEIYMNDAEERSCEDVFKQLEVTFTCTEATHDDCDSKNNKAVELEEDCKSSLSKDGLEDPEGRLEDLPDKLVRVAKLTAEWGKEVDGGSEWGTIRNTGSYIIESKSGTEVAYSWSAGYVVAQQFLDWFNQILLLAGAAPGVVCCLCSALIFVCTAAPPNPMENPAMYNVQMQQPMQQGM